MKKSLTLITLIFFSLNAISQVVNVQDYGATADNTSNDDKKGISEAIAACRKLSKPILFFPKGTYHINEDVNAPIINIENINNLIIQGSGSTLIVKGKKYPTNKPVFFFQNCKNLSIKNISVDYESVPWSQGKIINAGEDFMDVKLFSDFDIEDKEIKAYAQYDSIQGQQINMNETYSKSEWEWLDKTKNEIRIKNNKKNYETNSYIVLRHALYDNNTFIIYAGCEDVVFENVTVYACGGYPFNAYAAKNMSFINCKILRKSEKHWVTATADGAHLLDVRGEVKFENCHFENMCDDGINLHGYFQNILKHSSKTIQVAGEEKHSWYKAKGFAAGDKVVIVNAETQETIQTNTINKIVYQNGNDMTIKLSEKLPVLDENTDYKMANISTIGKLTVKNCTFKKNRARGILVSANDAVIENCTFERTLLSAILFEVSNGWIESTPAMNTIIQNNTFIDCGFFRTTNKQGNIDLEADITSENKENIYGVFKNITITNNTFKNNRIPLVVAKHVDGLKITNNKIENPVNGGNLIRYEQCKKTEITDNEGAVIETMEMNANGNHN